MRVSSYGELNEHLRDKKLLMNWMSLCDLRPNIGF